LDRVVARSENRIEIVGETQTLEFHVSEILNDKIEGDVPSDPSGLLRASNGGGGRLGDKSEFQHTGDPRIRARGAILKGEISKSRKEQD